MTRTKFDSIRVVSRAVPFLLASLQFLVPAVASAQQTDAGRSPTVSSAAYVSATERAPSQAPSPVHILSGRSQKSESLGSVDSDSLVFLFLPLATYATGGNAVGIALADVNGDGKPDLVVINCGDNTTCGGTGSVGVLLGNGDGTFQPAVVSDVGGFEAIFAVVADVNGDGKPDLVVVGGGVVAVLLGNGDGTFQPATTYAVSGAGAFFTSNLAVADVNGDGKPDLLVAVGLGCGMGCLNGGVDVLLGNGDGSFRPPVTYYAFENGIGALSVAVADVNRDGKPDLLVGGYCGVVDNCANLVAVLLGNGDGTFQSPTTFASGDPSQSSVAVGDVNDDGNPDLLVANWNSGTVGVMLGNGTGTFQPIVTYSAGESFAGGPTSVTASDVNGDGKLDLLASSGGMSLLLGNGDGTFQPAVIYDPPLGARIASTVEDVNGDGKPDVAVVQFQGAAGVLLNNSGAPPTTTSLAASVNPVALFQTVTYTAKVTPQSGGAANGTVVFMDGGYVAGEVALTGNQAQLNQSYTFVSTHSITAYYSGDLSKDSGSISKTLTENVRINSTITALTSNLNPSIYGQSVTFTAIVTGRQSTPPTGKVTFAWSGYTIGSATLNRSGVATLTKSNLNADVYPLIAVYKGDSLNQGSTSPILNQVVTQASVAAEITSSINPSTAGQAVTFTARITSPTVRVQGPVTFTAGKTVLGTVELSGDKATLTTASLPAGTTVVKVTYEGDSNIKGSSASVTQVVQ